MKLFLIEKKNGKEIFSYFSNKYENIPCYNTIVSILKNVRKVFANAIKNNYRKTRKGGEPGSNSVVAVDETLIMHDINSTRKIILLI